MPTTVSSVIVNSDFMPKTTYLRLSWTWNINENGVCFHELKEGLRLVISSKCTENVMSKQFCYREQQILSIYS